MSLTPEELEQKLKDADPELAKRVRIVGPGDSLPLLAAASIAVSGRDLVGDCIDAVANKFKPRVLTPDPEKQARADTKRTRKQNRNKRIYLQPQEPKTEVGLKDVNRSKWYSLENIPMQEINGILASKKFKKQKLPLNTFSSGDNVFYAELGKPDLSGIEKTNDKLSRWLSIDESHVAAIVSNVEIDVEKQCLVARVTPVKPLGSRIMDDLDSNHFSIAPRIMYTPANQMAFITFDVVNNQ